MYNRALTNDGAGAVDAFKEKYEILFATTDHLFTAISESSATRTPWGRDWKQTWQKEALGLRVRVRLAQGSLEGNIIHVEESHIQVRGTLKYMEKGVKSRKVVTETVTWSD